MGRTTLLALVTVSLVVSPCAHPALARGAEASVAVANLVPHAVGDRWLFGDREQQPTSSLLVTEPRDDGFVLETDDGHLHVLRLDAERGLLLVASSGLDADDHTFEPPLALLPAQLVAGASHSAQSAILEWRQGEELRRGARRVEVTIAAPAAVRTPAGEWLAWPISTRTTTTWGEAEPAAVTTEQTWYAPGVGPVRRRLDGAGARPVEALLEAKVGDRLLPP